MREIRPSGSGEGAVQSRPYLIPNILGKLLREMIQNMILTPAYQFRGMAGSMPSDRMRA